MRKFSPERPVLTDLPGHLLHLEAEADLAAHLVANPRSGARVARSHVQQERDSDPTERAICSTKMCEAPVRPLGGGYFLPLKIFTCNKQWPVTFEGVWGTGPRVSDQCVNLALHLCLFPSEKEWHHN